MRHMFSVTESMTAASPNLLAEMVEVRKRELGNVTAVRYGDFNLGSTIGGTRGVLVGNVTFSITIDTDTKD